MYRGRVRMLMGIGAIDCSLANRPGKVDLLSRPK